MTDACRRFRLALADGPLSDPHPTTCGACRQALEDAVRVRAALAALGEESPSPVLRRRVMEGVRHERASSWPRLLWLVPAAAAAALLLFFLVPGSGKAPPRSPGPAVPGPAPDVAVEATGPAPASPVPAVPLPSLDLPPIPAPVPTPAPQEPELVEGPHPPEPSGSEPPLRPSPPAETPVEPARTPEGPAFPPSPSLLASFEGTALASLTLGEPLQGPPGGLGSLAGRVVLIQFWNPDCAASVAQVPALAALDRRTKGQPCRLLAVFVGPGCARERVLEICEAGGLQCSVLAGGQIPGAALGWPASIVYGPAGQELFRGCLEEAAKVAEKAAQDAPRIWTGSTPYERLQGLARQIEKGFNPGQAAQALRRRLRATDPLERGEAARLLEALELHAAARREQAEALKTMDPDGALAALKELASDFSGDEIGTRLSAEARRQAADPALRAFRKALAEVDDLQRRLEALPSCKIHKQRGERRAQVACEGCRSLNEEVLAGLRKALKDLARRAKGTPAGDRARRLADSW